jgi:MFS family permease
MLVSFFFIVPQVVAAGLAGALADRWNRRYVLMLADAGQAVGSLLLLLSFASGNFQLWHLYAVTLLQSIFGVFQGPAFQASMTLMIPDEQRDCANAIQQLTGPISGIIAPALAGIVGSILIDLVTFLVAVLVVYRTHIPQPKVTTEGAALRGSMLADIFGGIRWMWARPNCAGTVESRPPLTGGYRTDRPGHVRHRARSTRNPRTRDRAGIGRAPGWRGFPRQPGPT